MRRNRFSGRTIVLPSERAARTRESNRRSLPQDQTGRREPRDKKSENKKERIDGGSGESDRMGSEEESEGSERWNSGPDTQGRVYARFPEVGREFTGRIIKFLAEESVFPLV